MHLLASTYFKIDDPVVLILWILVLLVLSGSIAWDIYKEKKESLDNQFEKGYISETEYKKRIKRIKIKCILGSIIGSLIILLLLFLLGLILMLIVFLFSVVLKKSKS